MRNPLYRCLWLELDQFQRLDLFAHHLQFHLDHQLFRIVSKESQIRSSYALFQSLYMTFAAKVSYLEQLAVWPAHWISVLCFYCQSHRCQLREAQRAQLEQAKLCCFLGLQDPLRVKIGHLNDPGQYLKDSHGFWDWTSQLLNEFSYGQILAIHHHCSAV